MRTSGGRWATSTARNWTCWAAEIVTPLTTAGTLVTRPLDWRPLRWTAVAAWLIVNAWLIRFIYPLTFSMHGNQPGDWPGWRNAAERLGSPELYADGSFVWSPVAAWLLAHAILPLGWPLLMVAHVAALAFLRDRLLFAIAITSAPFWMDTLSGNFFTFSVVAGIIAWRGGRLGALVYFALLMLMPRPVLFPLAAWLLWRDRSLILPVAALAGVMIVPVVASGLALAWMQALFEVGREWPYRWWDLGPTRFIGSAWLLVGVPLAIWLTFRNRLGWAGLAMSPYIAPQYVFMLLVELAALRPRAPR